MKNALLKVLAVAYIISWLLAGLVYWVNSPGKMDIRDYRQSYCDGDCGSDSSIGRELWKARYREGETNVSPTQGDLYLAYLFITPIGIAILVFLLKNRRSVKSVDSNHT